MVTLTNCIRIIVVSMSENTSSLKELSAYGIIYLQMKHILANFIRDASISRASFHWVFSSCRFQHIIRVASQLGLYF
jgi:hypothetical protein